MSAWIDSRWSSAVNHALLHSIWQCAAAAAVLWPVLRVARNPRFRYAASVLALLGASGAFVATAALFISEKTKPPIQFLADRPGLIKILGNEAKLQNPQNEATASTAYLVDHAAVVWIAGITSLSIYQLIGSLRLRKWRNEAKIVSNSFKNADWQALARRVGLRRMVAVGQSSRVPVPSVVGLWRPMILLPINALTGIDPTHLDVLIAHELAHLRRHDQWVNLLQISLETLLFYHPAIWWISRQIRIERECCCDDLAATVCGDRRMLAEALTGLATQFHAPTLLLAAGNGPLSRRVQRLLTPPTPRPRSSWLGTLLPVLVLLAGAVLYQHASFVLAAPAPATRPSTGPTTTTVPPTPEELQASRRLVAELDARLAELSTHDAELSTNLGPNSPQVVNGRRTIDQLQMLRAQAVDRLRSQERAASIPSEYYISGVPRAGVYALNEKSITIPQALITAGLQEPSADLRVEVFHRADRFRSSESLLTKNMDFKSGVGPLVEPGDALIVSAAAWPQADARDIVGEYYISGNVERPGVYGCSGRRIDLMQALIPAGFDFATQRNDLIALVHPTESRTEESNLIAAATLLHGAVIPIAPGDQIQVHSHDWWEKLLRPSTRPAQ